MGNHRGGRTHPARNHSTFSPSRQQRRHHGRGRDVRTDHGRGREHGALTHPCVGHAARALKPRHELTAQVHWPPAGALIPAIAHAGGALSRLKASCRTT
jgi:hypothetical protein